MAARRVARVWGRAAAWALFAGMLVAVACLLLPSWREQGSKAAVARAAVAGTAGASGRDWSAVRREMPDAVAWLAVEGTDIDLPVVTPTEGDPADFFVTHDARRAPSWRGAAFLDVRCEPSGGQLLVFGHHLGAGGGQFSDLRSAFEAEVFSGIGGALWETPDGARRFAPVCALRVPSSYKPLGLDETAGDPVGECLERLLSDARVTSPDAYERCERADAVLVLCTCASVRSGQPWRTLVVFASRAL